MGKFVRSDVAKTEQQRPNLSTAWLQPSLSPGSRSAAPATTHTPRQTMANGIIDGKYVTYRLEEAGQALLSLPSSGYTTRLRTSRIDIVRSALEAYGWENARNEHGRLRPAVPDSARISRMDEALGWISLIPPDRYVLRRIIGARSLVSPITERHLFTWRRLGHLLGADHKAIQRWYVQGLALIVTALNSRSG